MLEIGKILIFVYAILRTVAPLESPLQFLVLF